MDMMKFCLSVFVICFSLLLHCVGPDVIEYIINHAEVRAVVVEQAKLPQVRHCHWPSVLNYKTS